MNEEVYTMYEVEKLEQVEHKTLPGNYYEKVRTANVVFSLA